jgi:hypothetical protein
MNNNSKMITIYVQHQKRGEESHVTGLGEIVNKHSGAEVEQHMVRNC